MLGPTILVRTLSAARLPDRYGNSWQYLSRGDHHSKVACWCIVVDLLQNSPVLAAHALAGRVIFGINHAMVDFQQDRKKNLDLVLAVPLEVPGPQRDAGRLFDFVERYGISLTRAELALVRSLPEIRVGPVGAVQVALEAKACMTAHQKALPRLYDELSSSHSTVHGASDVAIAVGLAMVNIAPRFLSTDRNRRSLASAPADVTTHKQPRATELTVAKLRQLPRRASTGVPGFDAMGVVVVDCANDLSPVQLVTSPSAPQPGDILHYDSMIHRVSQLYESRFPRA